MPDSYMIVTEKDWEVATPKQQSWMIFNTMQNMDTRLKKLESHPLRDKLFAFSGGIIGGALASIGLK